MYILSDRSVYPLLTVAEVTNLELLDVKERVLHLVYEINLVYCEL